MCHLNSFSILISAKAWTSYDRRGTGIPKTKATSFELLAIWTVASGGNKKPPLTEAPSFIHDSSP